MSKTEQYWNQRRLVITGGTAGLGRALALAAARRGARVVATGRDPEKLRDLAAEAQRADLAIYPVRADVSDKDAVYRSAAEIHAALGGVDILVHNASYLGATPLRLLADTACEDLELALATNVVGPFRLTKALLPSLLLGRDGRGPGLVVAISSNAAVNAYPGWGSYSAAKAGFDQLQRVLDAELKEHGVRALSFEPGDMRTAMHFAAIPDADPAALADPAEVAERLLSFLEGV